MRELYLEHALFHEPKRDLQHFSGQKYVLSYVFAQFPRDRLLYNTKFFNDQKD